MREHTIMEEMFYVWFVPELYVAVLISFWFFLFAAQPKEIFLDGLKKL
jgi:hypothetical protein